MQSGCSTVEPCPLPVYLRIIWPPRLLHSITISYYHYFLFLFLDTGKEFIIFLYLWLILSIRIYTGFGSDQITSHFFPWRFLNAPFQVYNSHVSNPTASVFLILDVPLVFTLNFLWKAFLFTLFIICSHYEARVLLGQIQKTDFIESELLYT